MEKGETNREKLERIRQEFSLKNYLIHASLRFVCFNFHVFTLRLAEEEYGKLKQRLEAIHKSQEDIAKVSLEEEEAKVSHEEEEGKVANEEEEEVDKVKAEGTKESSGNEQSKPVLEEAGQVKESESMEDPKDSKENLIEKEQKIPPIRPDEEIESNTKPDLLKDNIEDEKNDADSIENDDKNVETDFITTCKSDDHKSDEEDIDQENESEDDDDGFSNDAVEVAEIEDEADFLHRNGPSALVLDDIEISDDDDEDEDDPELDQYVNTKIADSKIKETINSSDDEDDENQDVDNNLEKDYSDDSESSDLENEDSDKKIKESAGAKQADDDVMGMKERLWQQDMLWDVDSDEDDVEDEVEEEEKDEEEEEEEEEIEEVVDRKGDKEKVEKDVGDLNNYELEDEEQQEEREDDESGDDEEADEEDDEESDDDDVENIKVATLEEVGQQKKLMVLRKPLKMWAQDDEKEVDTDEEDDDQEVETQQKMKIDKEEFEEVNKENVAEDVLKSTSGSPNIELDAKIDALITKKDSEGFGHCVKCGYARKNVSNVRNHIESRHLDNFVLCPKCGMTSVTRHALIMHFSRKHSDSQVAFPESQYTLHFICMVHINYV